MISDRSPAYSSGALASLLLIAMLTLSGCAALWPSPPGKQTMPTSTLESPLAHHTVYWSQSTKLVALWASDAQVRWKIGGWAWQSPTRGSYTAGPGAPALADGILYAKAALDEQGSAAAYAFDARDGAVRWHTPLAGCSIGLDAEPPLVTSNVVYVALSGHSSGGDPGCEPRSWVYALRAHDGVVLWKVALEPGILPTLVLADGLLFTVTFISMPEGPSAGPFLTALRASDGVRVWRTPADAIAPVAAHGLIVLSHTSSDEPATHSVEAVRAADGRRVWQTPASLDGGTPVLSAGGLIYTTTIKGLLAALRAGDGSVAWRFQPASPSTSIGPPVVVNDRLYVGVGPALYSLDAASGAVVRFYEVFTDEETPDDPSLEVHPLYTWSRVQLGAGAIFVSASRCRGMCRPWEPGGTLFALDASSGRVFWTYREHEGFAWSTPLFGS